MLYTSVHKFGVSVCKMFLNKSLLTKDAIIWSETQ